MLKLTITVSHGDDVIGTISKEVSPMIMEYKRERLVNLENAIQNLSYQVLPDSCKVWDDLFPKGYVEGDK